MEVTPDVRDDRPNLAIDRSAASPYYGNIYVAWTDLDTAGLPIRLSRSTDDGDSFDDPVLVSTSGGIAVNLALDRDGVIYAVWDNSGAGLGGFTKIYFSMSTDGGESFSSEVDFSSSDGNLKGLRHGLKSWAIKAAGHPTIAVDTSGGEYDGRLYVAWADVRNGQTNNPPTATTLDPDIYLRWSEDQGETWSTPVRVNDDQIFNDKDQWFPVVDVDPYGVVGVLFYDSRNDANDKYTEAYLARSFDGGATFVNFPVSTVQFMPCTIRPHYSGWDTDETQPPTWYAIAGYIGDYLAIASDSHHVYAAWPDTRNRHPADSNAGLWQMYLARVPLALQGLVTEDSTLSGTVIVSGDVVIDSGVTLTVEEGTEFLIKGFRDLQEAGVEDGLIEIVVGGTLILEGSGADRPILRGDAGITGQWHGIRIAAGGTIEAPDGFVVQNAVVGLTIDSLAAVDTVQYVTIDGADVTGIWCESGDVVFLSDTIRDVPSGYGVFLYHCDPALEDLLISDCEYGLYAYQSSSVVTDTRIAGEGAYGVFVNQVGELDMGIDTLVLTGVEVSGYFTGAHLATSYKGHCRITGCAFLSGAAAGISDSSIYGLYLYQDAWVKMRSSVVMDWNSFGYGVYSWKSDAEFGIGAQGNQGGNMIQMSDSAAHGFRARHISATASDTFKAEGNWWGSDSPSGFWFIGKVDYEPYLTSPPMAKVSPQLAALPESTPQIFQLAQNRPNPFNPSTLIEFSLSQPSRVRVTVYNILGQVVKVLQEDDLPAGPQQIEWNGRDHSGRQVPTGVYLYRVDAGVHSETKKMVLLK